MVRENGDRPLPMYVSYSTFTTFVDWLSEMEVIPTQLDRSLWGGKFAGGTGSQLMSGLRFLGLLDGEKPTDRLEPLVRASGAERKHLIEQMLRDVYGGELIDGLKGSTPKMLNDRLETLGATDATLRKAFSFLVNAAKANEIPIAQGIAKKARNKPAGRKTPTGQRRPKGAQAQGEEGSTEKSPKRTPSSNTKTIQLESGGQVSVSISVDLFELSPNDRTFVLGLIDRLREYKDAHQQPVEAASGNNGEAPGLQESARSPGASERSLDA